MAALSIVPAMQQFAPAGTLLSGLCAALPDTRVCDTLMLLDALLPDATHLDAAAAPRGTQPNPFRWPSSSAVGTPTI